MGAFLRWSSDIRGRALAIAGNSVTQTPATKLTLALAALVFSWRTKSNCTISVALGASLSSLGLVITCNDTAAAIVSEKRLGSSTGPASIEFADCLVQVSGAKQLAGFELLK